MKREAKATLSLAAPIILGELAQMTLHLIDTAMIGAVNYKQLAAAALVFSVVNIPFVFGIGMTMSVSQLVSMAHGRRNAQLVSHYLFNGFWVCVATAIIISVGLQLSSPILFHLGQDPEVAKLAVPFMRVMSISVVPMLLFMALKQFTDGLEYTRTAMVLSLVALPLNAFINWLLIFGNWGFPRLEMMGAAYATLITRVLVFIVLAVVILKHRLFARYVAVRKNQWRFKRNSLRELLRIGIPSSFQIGMEAAAFAVSGILAGVLGAVEQASHQIALSCAAFTFMVSMGLAQAGSIRVSNAFGRGEWKKIGNIGKSTLFTAMSYGLLCAIVFASFRTLLPQIFNSNKQVISLAGILLLYAAIFQLSDATQAISAGLLRGVKDVKVPTYLIAVAYWVLGLPCGYLLAFKFKMGAPGIWLGLIIGLSFSAIFLSRRFFVVKRRKATEM